MSSAFILQAASIVAWSTLGTIANMLETQDSPVSSQQTSYLKNLLFGGMGSFNDLSFRTVEGINVPLSAKRKELYSSFQS